ncbi:hypothetical protein H0H92_010647 [Tricholoma furcatifolium]|nr:hypothetical protein H0H92_010647 [Tricholoma furcatifolium]
MARTVFPLELVLIILGNLKDQDTYLRSCALVCNEWRTQSQAYLFHTLILQTHGQCYLLRNLLAGSSHIASFIKNVSFNVDIGAGDDPSEVVDAIAVTLGFLKLECLSLGTCSQDDLNARDLPPILREAISFSLGRTTSMRSLFLQSFSLSNTDFRKIFMHTPAVRHLSVSNISCNPVEREGVEETCVRRTFVEELVVELGDRSLLEWFCEPHCCVSLTYLRSLTLVYDMDEAGHDLINKMLKNVGPSLENLHLKRVSERPLKDGMQLDFMCNPNLRRLRLSLAPNTRYIPSRCPPKWVLTTLERLSSPTAIEVLTLDIGIVDSLSFKRGDYSSWRRMAVLLSRELFPSLQSVMVLAPELVLSLPLVEELATQVIQGVGVTWVLEISDNEESTVQVGR